MGIYSGFICNCQKLETTQMSLCGIEPSNKKQRTTDQVTSCTILQDAKAARRHRSSSARREGPLRVPLGRGAHRPAPEPNAEPLTTLPTSLCVKAKEKTPVGQGEEYDLPTL